jgi:hypothetical protein
LLAGARQLDETPAAMATLNATRLRVRRLAARRRRMVGGLRDWLGITAVACFSLTLMAVAIFSILGR